MGNAELVTIGTSQSNSSSSVLTTQDGREFKIKGSKNSKSNPLSVPAFYSGVRFISETLSSLPKKIYKKDGKTRQAVDHYLNSLVSEYPNNLTNAVYLWESVLANAVMLGNGYVWANRRGDKIAGLYHLHSAMVIPFRADGGQWYAVHSGDPSVKPALVPASDMIHIRNFSDDGMTGISVIDQLSETLGLPRKLDDYLNGYFERGTAVNLVIESDGKLDREDIDNLRYGVESQHSGTDNMHKIMVLAGAKAKNLTVGLKDLAVDVLKQSSLDDIARVLRLPPHVLFSLNKSNYNSLEWLGTELVKYSFSPWVNKIELEIKRVLLTQAERDEGLYCKWNLEGLQRGDYQTRVNAGVSLVNNRLITPNEWRSLEDLEPYEGGDLWYGPLNTPAVGGSDLEELPDETGETPAVPDPAAGQAGAVAAVALNGAQIEAAVNVVVQLRAGVLTREAAVELLVAVGIGRPAATSMVESIVAAGPLETVTDQTPAPETVIPAEETYGLILADAAARVLTKQSKAFARHKDKDAKDYGVWLSRFSDEQGVYLAESISPVLETLIKDPTDLAFALQEATESYTAEVKGRGEEADPQTVIAKVMGRVK